MYSARDRSPGAVSDAAHDGTRARDARDADDAFDYARLRSAATIAAHEIGNSCLVIASFAQVLTEERTDLDASTIDSMLATITEHAHVIEQAKTDLAAAASPARSGPSLAVETLELRPKIEAAIACLPRSTPADITCPPWLRVRADPVRVQQILTNLLSNADKYGGPPIHVIAEPRGAFIEVSVIDHGPGVAEEFRSDLFQPDTRANAGMVAGSGLGLFVVAALTEAHGGRAWFTPTPGGGATFSFTLPT